MGSLASIRCIGSCHDYSNVHAKKVCYKKCHYQCATFEQELTILCDYAITKVLKLMEHFISFVNKFSYKKHTMGKSMVRCIKSGI